MKMSMYPNLVRKKMVIYLLSLLKKEGCGLMINRKPSPIEKLGGSYNLVVCYSPTKL